jgi:hypothetical protein
MKRHIIVEIAYALIRNICDGQPAPRTMTALYMEPIRAAKLTQAHG